jgi:phage terminase large subunit
MEKVIEIEIDLSSKDLYSDLYIPIISDRNRYILLYGSRDSAKSYTAAQKIVKNLLEEKYCKVVCLRKIFADIKDSQFETLWAIIENYGLDQYFKYIKSPLEITCLLNGNKILARGLDKPAKLKSIKDPTIVWAEEADEIGLEDFIKSDTSIRSSYSNVLLQFILTFNPEREESWINDYFFPPKVTYEKEDGDFNYVKSIVDNTTILHTTYKDNEFCPIERGKKYEALKNISGLDDNWYKVYCNGLWGNALKGLVFPNINYKNTFPDRENCKLFGYGVDFGFTNDPSTIIKCALAHGELWFEELTYKTGLVNTGRTNSIEAELKKHDINPMDEIIADSAEPKSIEEIKRTGYNIKGVTKLKGSIESSISEMKKYPINIIGSPNLKKEFRSYKYKEDKEGNSTNTPIDAWNHGIDSCRYFVIEKLMNRKQEFKVFVA